MSASPRRVLIFLIATGLVATGLTGLTQVKEYRPITSAMSILFQTRLPSPTSGSPSTYSVGGRQYVAVPVRTGSGGGWVSAPRRLIPEVKSQSWDETMTGVFVFALPQR